MDNFYKGKKILVAGGSGMIGTVLSKRLLEMGSIVSVASMDSPEKIKKKFGKLDIAFTNTDLRIFENCCKVVKNQDYVFNLICIKGSSQKGGSQAADQYVPLALCNFNLMEAARVESVQRYFVTGSINQYPNIPIRKEDDMSKGYPEANDRFCGMAKIAQEKQAEAYLLQYGWDAVRMARLTIVYGPFDSFNTKSHLIPAIICRVFNKENPLIVAGDGSAVRDVLFLDDAVDGILEVMAKAPPCVPINIGPGRGYSVKEIVETIVKYSGFNPEIIWDTSKPTGDPIRILDVERAKTMLSFNTKNSLEDGIKKTIEWYRENKDGE